MASEKPDKKEKKEKHKDKKDKEGKHSSEDGVRKSKKESKKEKRDKTAKLAEVVAANEAAVIKELDARLQADAASQAKALPTRSVSVADVEDGEDDGKTKAPALVGALVPFAKPLADEKAQKKVLKGVRKCKQKRPFSLGSPTKVWAEPVPRTSDALSASLEPTISSTW